jgi:succinoglycan biosynthesis transport protein ExoP
MGAGERTAAEALLQYLQVVRRRWYLFLLPLVLAPLIAVVITRRQAAVYEAQAQVLLRRLNLAASLSLVPQDQTFVYQPDRAVETQANLARVPSVAERVVRTVRFPLTAGEFLAQSSVKPRANADILEFRVQNGSPSIATRLATEYARQFITYSDELDRKALDSAFKDVGARLRKLRAAGDETSPLYANLLDKQERIAAIEALQTSDAVLVRPAEDAAKVAPRTKRAGVLGAGAGLILAVALVLLAEAADKRVRDESEIEEILGVPRLARIPRQDRGKQPVALLHNPRSAQAEAFRKLRTSLEFVSLERELRVILVTSALSREGKTTTAANLAVALAAVGQDVIACDLDTRRPALSHAFGIGPTPGLTDVALGYAELDQVLTDFDLPSDFELLSRPLEHISATDESLGKNNFDGMRSGRAGRLRILTLGSVLPPAPGEFVGGHFTASVLSKLRQHADYVIVDSGPVLAAGDALSLSAHADGLLVVSNLRLALKPALQELARLLATTPTPAIGLVITGVPQPSRLYPTYGSDPLYAGRGASASRSPVPARGHEPYARSEGRNPHLGEPG